MQQCLLRSLMKFANLAIQQIVIYHSEKLPKEESRTCSSKLLDQIIFDFGQELQKKLNLKIKLHT